MSAAWSIYDGFENYERAFARGKGVLFFTGHFGGLGALRFVHPCTATGCTWWSETWTTFIWIA